METKRKQGVVILTVLLAFLCACGGRQEETKEEWGSFTVEDCYSYDGKYLAKQIVERPTDFISKYDDFLIEEE